MHRFKKIIVVLGHPTTGTRSAALEWASRLARDNSASLRLASVVEEFPRITRWLLRSAEDLLEIIEKDRRERLEALAAPLRDQGVEVTTSVLRGRGSWEVVRAVLRHGHDLLIKDAEVVGDRLVGSHDWHLLRDCPCPVFLVKPAHPGQVVRRILAAVDLAPAPEQAELLRLENQQESRVRRDLSVKIADLATSLAERAQAELHLLHAWRVPGETLLHGETFVPQKEVDEYVESMHVAARRALDNFLGERPTVPPPAQVHCIKGDPAEVIVRFARSHEVDLIVMGTVARTGIPGFIIGNTAEATLRRVECSVLTVKPEGFVSPVTPA